MDDVEETCIVELRSGSRKLEYREGFGPLTLYAVLVDIRIRFYREGSGDNYNASVMWKILYFPTSSGK